MLKILILLYILPGFLLWAYSKFWEKTGSRLEMPWKDIFMPFKNLTGYIVLCIAMIVLVSYIHMKIKEIWKR